ncbi:MAG: OmpA family protein [Rhodothermales bacterium]|nr:OmpA family protein [Rhodothermales bacterium]
MNSLVPPLLGVVLIALLTLVCSCHVEQDVQATAAQVLSGGGIEWGEVEADGRNIYLSGVAPTAEAAESLASEIEGTEAVVDVVNRVQVHDMSDADLVPVRGGLARSGYNWVELGRSDRTLEMGGVAASESEKAEVGGVAVPHWPWGPVDNRLRVASSQADRQLLACRSSLNQILANETVNFEFGSAAITTDGRGVLDQLLSVLDDCPESAVRVEAHSDNVGDTQANLTLSQARAESVVTYLQLGGVDSDRLTAVGYGESRPVATNSTDEGRAENRRVEFRIGQ